MVPYLPFLNSPFLVETLCWLLRPKQSFWDFGPQDKALVAHIFVQALKPFRPTPKMPQALDEKRFGGRKAAAPLAFGIFWALSCSVLSPSPRALQTSISIEIRYQAQDGTVGTWSDKEFLETPGPHSEGDSRPPLETDSLLPGLRQSSDVSPGKSSQQPADRSFRR